MPVYGLRRTGLDQGLARHIALDTFEQRLAGKPAPTQIASPGTE
jgi:hypothetical protein